jgi:hypothetical protein
MFGPGRDELNADVVSDADCRIKRLGWISGQIVFAVRRVYGFMEKRSTALQISGEKTQHAGKLHLVIWRHTART